MEAAKNAVDYVKESVQGASSETSKQTNKTVAKDSNNSATTRASAAKDALGDQVDKDTHDAKAQANKPFGSSD